MKFALSGFAMAISFIATAASAQVADVDLNGPWRCVAQCLGPTGSAAFITQNGSQLNIVNDAGQASRAWIDYPGRIWIANADQGAIYSPDGSRIQFDGGTLWVRPLGPPPRGRR